MRRVSTGSFVAATPRRQLVGWFRSACDLMRTANKVDSTRCRQRNKESLADVVPGRR
jgi:hypothetical protein